MLRFIMAATLLFFVNVASATSISVVTEESAYQYTQNGQVTGPVTRLIRRVLDESGLDYHIKSYPWPRAYAMAKSTPNTMIYSIMRTKSRENKFHWIGKIASSRLAFYSKKSAPVDNLNSLNQLKEYSIGTVKDDMMHHYLKRHKFPKISIVNNLSHSIRNFEAGRYDLIVWDELSLKLSCMKKLLDCNTIKPVYEVSDEVTDLYFALSKSTPPAVVNEVTNAFLRVTAQKSINEIIFMQ